jgi:hypothetical protein
MSKNKRGYTRKERPISVRVVRREGPDLHKLGRVFTGLVQARAEAEAQAQVPPSCGRNADGDDGDE